MRISRLNCKDTDKVIVIIIDLFTFALQFSNELSQHRRTLKQWEQAKKSSSTEQWTGGESANEVRQKNWNKINEIGFVYFIDTGAVVVVHRALMFNSIFNSAAFQTSESECGSVSVQRYWVSRAISTSTLARDLIQILNSLNFSHQSFMFHSHFKRFINPHKFEQSAREIRNIFHDKRMKEKNEKITNFKWVFYTDLPQH